MDERELSFGIVPGRDSVQRLAIVKDRWGLSPVPRWLTTDKLAALGFDVSAPAVVESRTFYDHQRPRRAFVALEFDGPAWQDFVRDLHRRQATRARQLEEVRRGERDASAVTERADLSDAKREQSTSRLVPIDASIDPAALRRAYPDRRMYIVAPATIRILMDERRPRGTARWDD